MYTMCYPSDIDLPSPPSASYFPNYTGNRVSPEAAFRCVSALIPLDMSRHFEFTEKFASRAPEIRWLAGWGLFVVNIISYLH